MIAEFRRAGIRPLMLTGDQATTAEAVADAPRFNGDGDLSTARAADLDTLDENGVRSLVRKTSVFSRVSPSHKLQIVRAIEADRARVDMTGDGDNDAPVLKAADTAGSGLPAQGDQRRTYRQSRFGKAFLAFSLEFPGRTHQRLGLLLLI